MIGPLESLGLVDVQYHMMMVGHDRIGANVDRKDLRQRQDSIFDPLAAVFKAFAGDGITAAQEGPANTAGRAVIVGCGIQ